MSRTSTPLRVDARRERGAGGGFRRLLALSLARWSSYKRCSRIPRRCPSEPAATAMGRRPCWRTSAAESKRLTGGLGRGQLAAALRIRGRHVEIQRAQGVFAGGRDLVLVTVLDQE